MEMHNDLQATYHWNVISIYLSCIETYIYGYNPTISQLKYTKAIFVMHKYSIKGVVNNYLWGGVELGVCEQF